MENNQNDHGSTHGPGDGDSVNSKRQLLLPRMLRIVTAETLIELAQAFPQLPLEELRYLSNESVDALTTALTIKQTAKTLDMLIASHPTERTSVALQGKIASLRSGLIEDEQEIFAGAANLELTRKYGMPVMNTSDHSLERMGFVNKNKADQEQ